MTTEPTQLDHFRSAEVLLGLADEAAARGRANDDPVSALAAVAGAAVHILAAQVHAVLAVAEAIRATPSDPGRVTSNPDEWLDITEPGGPILWRNRRDPTAYSTTGGRTWYLDDGRAKS